MIAFFAGDVAGGASSQDQVPVVQKEPHVGCAADVLGAGLFDEEGTLD